MSKKGPQAANEELPLPHTDDIHPEFSVDNAADEEQEASHRASASQSSAENEDEAADAELESESEASQKSDAEEGEVSNEAEAVAPVTVEAAATAVTETTPTPAVAANTSDVAPTPVAASIPQESVGKIGKVVEVQPSMQESVGKLPKNLAARFTEALAAAEKATDTVKMKVGTEEHGSTKTLVTQFEEKNRQATEASKVALATPAPTDSIGKVAKAFQ